MEDCSQKKILIIEDHRDMMTILKRFLQEKGFLVSEAETAEIGLELFKSEPPDLVLMDIMLPGMSGLNAISKIKQEQKTDTYIPIIIITAKNDVNDIVKGLDSGADDYVVKPFHFDELMARIKTSLRLKELNELLVRQSTQLESANKEIGDLNRTLVGKNRELRKNIYSLHSLFEVSLELNSILDLNRLINSVLLTIIGQFSCKTALFMYAPKHNQKNVEILNSKGLHQKRLAGFTIAKKDTLFSHLNTHKHPVFLDQISSIVGQSEAIDKLRALNIEVVTPLFSKNKVEGLICLGKRVKKDLYKQRELEHISILSNIISIAVSNASLYNEVEQLSYTDGMTELHNFRYFELRLKEEVIRHKRTDSGLSLLILDVDHFKNYNDNMGHPAGDEVLRSLSHILRETVRENDIVARYGGEEFAVILPAVDKEGAAILAERIRENVESTYFEHEQIQPLGNITVSVGVASLPDDADNYKSLMHKADMALYSAKRGGRNKIMLFQEEMVQNI